MARRRKKKTIRVFKVLKGCNVALRKGQEEMDFGGGRLLVISNAPPEARYEPGAVVREDQFPPQADIGYFLARGALVETGVVELEPEAELIEEEVN